MVSKEKLYAKCRKMNNPSVKKSKVTVNVTTPSTAATATTSVKKTGVKTGFNLTTLYPVSKSMVMHYQKMDAAASSSNANKCGQRTYFYLNDINRPRFGQTTDFPLPRGYNDFNNVYSRFKVSKTKVKVEFAPNKTGAEIFAVFQALNSSVSIDITGKSIGEISQMNNVWTYPLPIDKKFVFKRTFDIPKLEGITKNQFYSDLSLYHGTLSPIIANLAANAPQRQPSFVVTLINASGDTLETIPFEIEIDYKTKFNYRASIPESKTPAP